MGGFVKGKVRLAARLEPFSRSSGSFIPPRPATPPEGGDPAGGAAPACAGRNVLAWLKAHLKKIRSHQKATWLTQGLNKNNKPASQRQRIC